MSNTARILTFLMLALSLILWLANVLFAVDHLSGFKVWNPWMERWTPYIAQVDISTVTTLVLLLTLCYIHWGILKAYRETDRQKVRTLWHEHYPFHPKFRALLIQLGLLGTIFAFIVAFGQLARTAGDSFDPKILIVPLGTALWSTFAGIFVAYLVVPLVAKLFLSNMVGRGGEPTGADQEVTKISHSLGELEEQMIESVEKFKGLNSEVLALQSNLKQTDSTITQSILQGITSTNNNLRSLDQTVGQLHSDLGRVQQSFSVLPPIFAESQEGMRCLAGEVRSQRTETMALRQTLTLVEQETAEKSTAFADHGKILASSITEIRALGHDVSSLRDGIGGLASALRYFGNEIVQVAQLKEHFNDELLTIHTKLRQMEQGITVLPPRLQSEPSTGQRPAQGLYALIPMARSWLNHRRMTP